MKFFLFIFGIVGSLTLLSCSEQKKIIAQVGNTTISAQELKTSMELAKENYDPLFVNAKTNIEFFRNNILTRRIQEEVLLAEAKRRGIILSEDDVDQMLERMGVSLMMTKKSLEEQKLSYDAWRKHQRRRLVIQKMAQDLTSEEMSSLIDSLMAITPITINEENLKEITLEETP